MTHPETIAWAEAQEAAGHRDAMGRPFTAWLLARYLPDGRVMRDLMGGQVFETQAEFKARYEAEVKALATCGTVIKCNGSAWGLGCPKRHHCHHHNAHQLASIEARSREYNVHDARQGWTLLACQDLEQWEAFAPLLPSTSPEAGEAPPIAIGQTLELFA